MTQLGHCFKARNNWRLAQRNFEEALRLLPTAEAANKKELIEKVSGALAKLPVEYRLVVTLRDVEGLSAEETGKILKLSVPAVKSRLHRGRLFLRDEFERAFGKKGAER